LNVEAVKSIEVAAIIALNRAANVYWLPPAGYNTGRIPAALSNRQKYVRTYNYADDPNSDIARLYDANINPTRVNDQGQFIYGQKTMLKRLTALNRLNVIMLVAGIHKRFADFLDTKVFQLNTASLRSNIQAELQAQLELIKSANPAGLTEGIVICDETNNTPDIIDTNQLIVDVVLQPTRTAEFITLRTTVQRTGDQLNITNVTVIGG
jgi:phage tail sheath protein FI